MLLVTVIKLFSLKLKSEAILLSALFLAFTAKLNKTYGSLVRAENVKIISEIVKIAKTKYTKYSPTGSK